MSKPKIRFKGYEEDWEQRKVKEFAIESEVKGHSGKDAKKLTVKLHNKGVYVADEKIQGSDNTQYYIRRAGQFIYGKQNFFNGAIGIVPKKLDKYESTKDVPAFDVSSDVNVDWLYYYIARPEIYKPQEALCTGTGSKRFHVNNFYNLSLAIPKMDEQIKIKEYFVHLDNLITLHQRKCEETKKLKKYMLQKMFPQNGKRVPEIRFVGFTEDWEQRKLSDITLKIGSGKTPSGGKNAYVDDGIPLIRSQNINNDRVDLEDIVFIDEETDNSMENSRVFTDDVLLNITGASIGRSAVYRGKDKANVNQHVCIIRPTKDFDSDFIQLNLASNFGQKQIDASQAGGGREGLNFQEIGKMSFMFPSNQEQMKIGVYFNHIDYLITLHQRKYEELQKIKKFMLQNMFI